MLIVMDQRATPDEVARVLVAAGAPPIRLGINRVADDECGVHDIDRALNLKLTGQPALGHIDKLRELFIYRRIGRQRSSALKVSPEVVEQTVIRHCGWHSLNPIAFPRASQL
jgi:hypothetical protein